MDHSSLTFLISSVIMLIFSIGHYFFTKSTIWGSGLVFIIGIMAFTIRYIFT